MNKLFDNIFNLIFIAIDVSPRINKNISMSEVLRSYSLQASPCLGVFCVPIEVELYVTRSLGLYHIQSREGTSEHVHYDMMLGRFESGKTYSLYEAKFPC